MKKLYRISIYALSVFALCSCATGGEFHSTRYVNGWAMPASNWGDARYYMDEQELAPVLSPNYGERAPGLYCGRTCRYEYGR